MSLKKSVVLLPHQQRIQDKVEQRDGNLIAYHSVGTGKTLSSLAMQERLKKLKKAKKALVVVPASLRDNYAKDGVKKFTTNSYAILGNKQELEQKKKPSYIKDIEGMTPKKSADYNIVSYDLYKRDPEKYIKNTGSNTVIYDEIHKAKNDGTKITDVIRKARPFHRNFIGLTGSLTSNSPGDMVPIIDAMTDGKHILGSKDAFIKRFTDEDSNGKKTLKNRAVLKAITSPYVDFVSRDDMEGGKPPKRKYLNHDLTMNPIQSDVYRYTLDKLDALTKAKLMVGAGKLSSKETKAIANKLMASRQASNSIRSIAPNTSLSEAFDNSIKAKTLINNVDHHIKHTPDGQVIIGTQFINGGIDILEHGLKKKNIPYSVFIGKGNKGVNEKSRKKGIEDYNSRKARVMLISSAGGEGLNLPNTTAVHMLDGHFNPEVTNQMEARGIRFGGLAHRDEKDRVVELHRYTAKPDIKVTKAVGAVFASINPLTYANRMLDGEKIWQNPSLREFSSDEWISEVSKNKHENNKEMQNMFKTAAMDLIKRAAIKNLGSEAKVMKDYHDEFGDKIENVIGTDNWVNREKEQVHVDKLRNMYKNLSTAKKYLIDRGKGGYYNMTDADYDDNNEMKASSFFSPSKNPTAKTVAIGAGIGGVGHAIARHAQKGLYDYENKSTGAIKALRARHYIGTSAAKFGGILGAMGLLHGATTYFGGNTGSMTKSKAKAKLRLKDEELLRLIRGENIKKEKVKVENIALS